MVQRLLLAYLLLLTLTTGYLFWQSQQRKLAYVDSVKLLNGYQAMLDARKAYAAKSRVWQANRLVAAAGIREF